MDDTQFKAIFFFYAEWLRCGQTARASCRPFKSHVSVIKRKQSYTEEDEHLVYLFLFATLKLATWQIQKRRQKKDVECRQNDRSPPACSLFLFFRGFCYFNSVAIAAKQLQHKLSVSKILIVDWVRQQPHFCSPVKVFFYWLILYHSQFIPRMFTMATALRKCFTATQVFYIFHFIAMMMGISSLAVDHPLR